MGVIESGRGTRHVAEVDENFRLQVGGVVESEQLLINRATGKVWTVPFSTLNPTGAGDYVLYVQNTGVRDLEMETARISTDTAITQVEFHRVTGTPSAVTAITAVSRNLGFTVEPDAIIGSSVDFTGLTDGGTLLIMNLAVVATTYTIDLKSTIILPQNTAIAILVETATANITGTITLTEV